MQAPNLPVSDEDTPSKKFPGRLGRMARACEGRLSQGRVFQRNTGSLCRRARSRRSRPRVFRDRRPALEGRRRRYSGGSEVTRTAGATSTNKRVDKVNAIVRFRNLSEKLGLRTQATYSEVMA